ncbi:MAG: DUF402 domain-containing protein [Chloroflexi bacterium]|jgi:hypothetical protein|nr:DUF402 domain-containing protein [Chloroflexota bacterium]
MIARDVTITKVKAGQQQAAFSYSGDIVYRDDEMIVARCPWPSSKVVDLGPFALEPGDIFMEYYYRSQWFNIFAIYDAAGALKGWYCNVTAPVEILSDEIRWHDLEVDLLVLPDGTALELDWDDLEKLHPSPQVRQQAEQALATLHRWVREKRAPFRQL